MLSDSNTPSYSLDCVYQYTLLNLFVVLFVKKEFHNRNKIRINGNNPRIPESKWLNIPVADPKDYIMYAKIKNNVKHKNGSSWNKQILQIIKLNYNNAPFFKKYFPELEDIFSNEENNLISINMKLIRLKNIEKRIY